MLDDLRAKTPAMRTFNSSLTSSDNSALYRKEFRDNKAKMRLMRTVPILGWLGILLSWTAWIAKHSHSIHEHENRSNNRIQAVDTKVSQPDP